MLHVALFGNKVACNLFLFWVSTTTPHLACCVSFTLLSQSPHTPGDGVWGLTSAAFVYSLYLFHSPPLLIPPLPSCCLVSIFSSCPHPQGFICICFPFAHSLSPWSNMWWTGELIAFCGWDGWARNQKLFFFFYFFFIICSVCLEPLN